jgi:hypothetical protein
MAAIDERMRMDWSDEQFSNPESPRFESFEPVSNVKSKRLQQSKKPNRQIVSIDEGMQIH